MTIQMMMVTNLLGLVGGIVFSVRASAFDAHSFNQLNEPDKQAFILAALDTRESQLQNFAYVMNDQLYRFTPGDGESTFLREHSVVLKRKANKLLLRAEKLGPNKQPLIAFSTNWDGNTSRSLRFSPRMSVRNSAAIRDSEDQNFTDRAYNHILGLRVLDSGCLSLAEWFKDALEKGKPIETTGFEEDGKSLLSFKVSDGGWSYEWVLDSSRDYMPVRAEVWYRKDDNYNSDVMSVTEAMEVDGFWVPRKVLRTTGTSISDGQGKNTYEISSFTRNTVTDDDLKIEFPPGTEVVDSVKMIAYRILADGRFETLRLYNPATGEVSNPYPPERASKDAIEDAHGEIMAGEVPPETEAVEKPKEATEREGPQMLPKLPLPVAEARTTCPTWLWLCVLFTGILLVSGGIALFLLRSARKNP